MYRLIVVLLFIAVSCSNFSDNKDVAGVQKSDPELDSLLFLGIDQTSRLIPDSARQTLTLLLLKAQRTNQPRYELLAYNNLGRLYQLIHVEDLASNYYLKAVDVAHTNDLSSYLNILYNNLGIIYLQNGVYDESRKYLEKAVNQSRKQGDTIRVGLNLINLGLAIDGMGMDSLAVTSFYKAIRIFKQRRDSLNLCPAYDALAEHFYNNMQFDTALTYYQKALDYSPRSERLWLRWTSELKSGKTLLKLGYPDSAAAHIHKSISGFEQSNNLALLIEAYKALAEVENSRQNYKNAIAYANQTMELQDSLLAKKSSRWTSELQMNYEFGQKVKQVEDLQADTKRRQWLWVSGTVLLVVMALLLTYGLRNAIKVLKQRNLILQKEQEVSRLKLESRANEQQSMQLKLEYKNRELASKAIHLISRDETFNHLRKTLIAGLKAASGKTNKVMHDALNIIKSEERMEEEWHSFIVHFEEVHPDFFQILKNRNEGLTSGDLRMCAYLAMDFSAKEIARIFNITPESVRKRKQRLREKLDLEKGKDLNTWLDQQRG